MGMGIDRRASGGVYPSTSQAPRRGGHFANLTWTPNKDKDTDKAKDGDGEQSMLFLHAMRRWAMTNVLSGSQNPSAGDADQRITERSSKDQSRDHAGGLQSKAQSSSTPRAPKGHQSKFSFALKPKVSAPNLKTETNVWANPTSTKPPLNANPTPTQGNHDSRSSAQIRTTGRTSLTWQANHKSALPTPREVRPRRTLPTELAQSDSVWYRKPGNESVVGSGTYGKVFKAVHVYTRQIVALKKIRMEGERDGFPVTAVREVKLLQSLHHENVVELIEVMVEKNLCYMVFEYVSHDLTGLLNHPTFKLEMCHKKHLSRQLFEGLDYLHHRAGVLHRDIKAANILVSREGQLKLADFGLARFYTRERQVDYTNRVITIWYRSPELLLGETLYGPAVDIWSAACVMVEIFTRHAIFPGDGGEINQLDKIYQVLGTPSRASWPGIVDMAWFELLKPREVKKSSFDEKYAQ